MTEREDIDMLAAEYVLGTLDAAERTAVAARRQREPDLAAAIEAWERRMSPLSEMVPPVTPPPGLFDRIVQRLDGRETAGADVIGLRRRLTLWRRAAIAASAVAAGLVAVIGVREAQWRDLPQNYVGVFQRDDASPVFLLTIDLEKRQLTVRPVTARPEPARAISSGLPLTGWGPRRGRWALSASRSSARSGAYWCPTSRTCSSARRSGSASSRRAARRRACRQVPHFTASFTPPLRSQRARDLVIGLLRNLAPRPP